MSKFNLTFKNKKYSIDKSLLSGAISNLETVLSGLSGGGDVPTPTDSLAPGLYQAGAIALYEEQGASAVEGMMTMSWEQLLADGTVNVEDGVVYTNYNTGTAQNTSSASLVGDLMLPDDSSINALGSDAFGRCNKLTGVFIPSSVNSIGEGAFCKCGTLTSLNIPDSVTSIGDSAFDSSGLTSITIPYGVTSIPGRAFYCCNSLTTINIPSSVTSIGYTAFDTCINLKSVYITDISKWCEISFADSYANPLNKGANLYVDGELVTNIVIPKNITTINPYVFYGCSSLTSVSIHDGVTIIGKDAFVGCNNITNFTIDAGNTMYTSNGNCLIENASKTLIIGFNNSVIPSDGSVTSIGSSAFNGCSGLTSITIPDSVTSIGNSAFRACKGLTSITIGNGAKSFENGAFSNCSNLTKIYYDGNVASWCNIVFKDSYAHPFADITKGSLYIKNASGEYELATNLVIPDSVTSIQPYAFYYCTSVSSVTIGNSVTSIGYQAFFKCTGISNVTIGNSVKIIDESAFYGCTVISNVTMGNSVTSIGDYAFKNCSKLKSINIPNTVTSIGDDVFYSCSNLNNVTIPNSVTSIGKSAFKYCFALDSINFDGTVTQWNAISKGSGWKTSIKATYVQCTDGQVAI